MSNRWTDEQLSAITTRDCNLLVSAAAGAGKTAVLVERIIRRITDPETSVDVDRLLIVTFTKAAAAEMRERIGAAIARELNLFPESVHLARQATLLARASITTLHSFCLDVLRQYFYRVDLDPGFRVVDDSEAALMRLEVLEEIFEEKYLSGTEDFLALVDAYGGDRDDTLLQDMVLSLYEFAVSNPNPEAWLRGLVAGYQVAETTPIEELPWGRGLLDWCRLQLAGCLAKLEQACRLAIAPGGPEAYLQTLQEDKVIVSSLLNHDSWDRLHREISGIQFSKLKSCRDKNVDDDLKERVKQRRDEVKKAVTGIAQELFARSGAEYIKDLGKVAPYVQTITDLVCQFIADYRRAKHARGLVDFTDLEHYCLQILQEEAADGTPVPSAVAMELREHFAEVFVDEYQDINTVQEAILKLVSRQNATEGSLPNMFMVGDVKQSIYRFRLAEPSLFMGKYAAYPRGRSAAGAHHQAVDLTRNFRSRQEVVDAVNYCFRQLMTPRVAEISYDEKAELVCGAVFPESPGGVTPDDLALELHLLEKNLDGAVASGDEGMAEDQSKVLDTDDPAELDGLQREARLVARRIKELVNGTEDRPGPQLAVFDKHLGSYRPVRYKDIVILMRATRTAAPVFTEEFRTAGIPVYADLNTGYFAVTEVETMMSLLKIIDNPRQDVPLAAVLRSPIVGLGAEQLALIRLQAADAEALYYDSLLAAAAEQSELAVTLKERLQHFLAALDNWRTMARQYSLSELIWRLYDETGFYAYVGGLPGGAQRQANLRAFYDRARQYEATTYRGLFRFLRFVERFRELGNDLGTARALGENEDVVRIMSIHKSKGLEFPVVIVAGLGAQFNKSDLRQKIFMHKEYGLGLPVVERDMPLTYPSLLQKAIGKKIQAELLAEELRVLYVALTRAKEKLILVGSVRDLAKAANRWCEHVPLDEWALPDAYLAQAKTFLDWVCPAAVRHDSAREIRQLVQCEEEPCGLPAADRVRWQVRLWSPRDCILVNQEEPVDTAELMEKVKRFEPITVESSKLADSILHWYYPFAAIVGKPSKVSVTEVKRRFAEIDEEAAAPYTPAVTRQVKLVRPKHLQETRGLSPAERGTAMHLVMQHLNFNRPITEEVVLNQVSQMKDRELLSAEQASVIDTGSIACFINSELGQRIARSPQVFREKPFTLSIPASVIYPEVQTDENLLVQGVIDCMFQEKGGIVLVDYKTDYFTGVPGEDALRLRQLTDQYAGQMKIYGLAVEQITGVPVLEKHLYFFGIGKSVKVEEG